MNVQDVCSDCVNAQAGLWLCCLHANNQASCNEAHVINAYWFETSMKQDNPFHKIVIFL